MKLFAGFGLAYLGLILVGIAGWITNLVWTFQHASELTKLLLGLGGAFLGPLGAVHGIGLWFHWWN
jgi:hypothetical protein